MSKHKVKGSVEIVNIDTDKCDYCGETFKECDSKCKGYDDFVIV